LAASRCFKVPDLQRRILAALPRDGIKAWHSAVHVWRRGMVNLVGGGDQNPNETPLKDGKIGKGVREFMGVLYSTIWPLDLSDMFLLIFKNMFSLYSYK